MRITQGTFSYLPDLTDDEIAAQIQYAVDQGWAVAVEFTDDPHPRNVLWEMWGLPMFGIADAAAAMHEVRACRVAYPGHYVRVSAYDASLGRQTTALSFIVNRPATEPGFRLDRQEAADRQIRYSLHPYAAERPAGERYGPAAPRPARWRQTERVAAMTPERARAARLRHAPARALRRGDGPSDTAPATPGPAAPRGGEGAATRPRPRWRRTTPSIWRPRNRRCACRRCSAGSTKSSLGWRRSRTGSREIAALLLVDRLRGRYGLTSSRPSLHMCFTGSPGTGKTTVAMHMGELLRELGYLRNGQLVSVTRDDLVGQYVGHTAPKTKEVLKRAMGGVLLIDEAYYLYRPENERDYGQEAIEILLQFMEAHREDLVVILAGYADRMDVFFRSNPGMASRIAHHIDFPDFTLEELLQIAGRCWTASSTGCPTPPGRRSPSTCGCG